MTHEEQKLRWEARVASVGWKRAVMNVGDDPGKIDLRTEQHRGFVAPHLKAALTKDDRTLLDYGCGWGRWTPWLGQIMYGHLNGMAVGVDVTPTLIEKARKYSPSPFVWYDLVGADGVIPIPAKQIDVIFAYTVLSAITNQEMLDVTMGEWRRVLRPGGLIFVVDNTSKADGRAVRSPYSISRTVEEYRALFFGTFGPDLALVSAHSYVEVNEVNHLFVGRTAR